MPVKFAIGNEIFGGWTIERTIEYCARLGYDGLELAPFTLAEDVRSITAQERGKIRHLVQAHGLEVVGLHWLLASPPGLYLNHPDDGIRRRTVEYLAALADFCADLGGHIMVFGSPAQRNVQDGWSYHDTWRRTVHSLQQVCTACGKRGVTLCVEPLATQETNLVISLEDGVKMVEEVDHPACRLHLDVKALAAAEAYRSIAEAIRAEGGRYLHHFHANDKNRGGPGFGETDFRPIARALQEIGYQGYVPIEVFDQRDGPEATAERGLAYLRECFAGCRAPAAGDLGWQTRCLSCDKGGS